MSNQLNGPARSDKVVFLLGAGASVDHGLPVMANFLDTARRRAFDDYQDETKHLAEADRLKQLLQFHAECRRSSWAVNRCWDNIEEIYTQADLRRLARVPNADESEKVCSDIAWAIWDIYRDDGYADYNITEFTDSVFRSDLKPAIVTTNYDLVAERSIGMRSAENCYARFHYPGFDVQVKPGSGMKWLDGSEPAAPPDSIPIVKLHGSVNWFRFDDGEYQALYDHGLHGLDSENLGLFGKRLAFTDFSYRLLQQCGRPTDSADKMVPTIVPPMLGKTSNLAVIAHQWQEAIRLIGEARHLWVIGYSFPTTDTFMSRLLAEGIQHNADLELIGIINPQPEEEFQDRLAAIFNATFLSTRVRYYSLTSQSAYKRLSNEAWRDSHKLLTEHDVFRQERMRRENMEAMASQVSRQLGKHWPH